MMTDEQDWGEMDFQDCVVITVLLRPTPMHAENALTTRSKLTSVFLAVLISILASSPLRADVQQDERAMTVLKEMSAYKATLDQAIITGVTYTDARLGAGLMVSNAEEISVSIKRPASLVISSFNGEASSGFYFDNGLFTFFNSGNELYAQAEIPKDIEAALKFVLEELDIEAPLINVIYRDAASHFITSDETIIYVQDKARVNGTDCHHLAIRGKEVDVQLWVEEGDRPLPRKIMMTSKWEGGSPRFIAHLDWDTEPEFAPGLFQFKVPDGATKVDFVRAETQQ